MGTRADFYIGKGLDSVWLGSIGMDGDPGNVADELSFSAKTPIADEDDWVESVAVVFRGHTEHTLPERGWPWPWDDSNTTDYAYTLDQGRVWASNFGCEWRPLENYLFDDYSETLNALPSKIEIFPDMSKIQNIRYDSGNAPMIFGVTKDGHFGLVNDES